LAIAGALNGDLNAIVAPAAMTPAFLSLQTSGFEVVAAQHAIAGR
jgi:hypothetical protein